MANTTYTLTKGSAEYQISHIHWEAAAAPEPTIELDQASVILNETNNTAELTATVANSDDEVTWTSSDEGVATVAVDATDSKKATVTLADGVTEGTATITATLGTGEGAPTATCTVTVSSHTHVWGDGVVTTPATCTTAGVKTFTCTGEGDCPDDNTKTGEIAALGHNTADNATAVADVPAGCTTPGLTGKKICGRNNGGEVCQEVVVAGTVTPAEGHVFDKDGGACTVCGDVEAPTAAVTIDYSKTEHDSPFVLEVTGYNTSGYVKFEGSNKLVFKAPGDGTVVFTFSDDSNSQSKSVKVDGTTKDLGSTAPAVTMDTAVNRKITVEKGSGTPRLVSVTWTPKSNAPATRAVTFAGDNATVSQVKQGETTLAAVEGVYTANQTEAITFQVTADADYEITAVKQGETALTATGGVYTIPAGTEDAAITITATQLKTGTPAFSETEVQLQSRTDNKVALTLTSSLPAGTVYRLHPTATSEESMGVTAGGVTASDGKITFTLKAIPAADVTYYVKAYDGNKAASEAAPIAIKVYVPATDVKFNHVSDSGEITHVIYLGGSGTGNATNHGTADEPEFPSAWKLAATVYPDTATDKTYTISNALGANEDCIHVTGDGTVSALKVGTGTVELDHADVQAKTCTIIVKPKLDGITVKQGEATVGDSGVTLALGGTATLTAEVAFATAVTDAMGTDAAALNDYKHVKWAVKEGGDVIGLSNGAITTKKAGSATITVSDDDGQVSKDITVTVGKGTPVLTITPGTATAVNGAVTLKVNGAKGMTPTLTFKQGEEDKTGEFTVPAATADADGSFTFTGITVPANATDNAVSYTVTASVAGNDDWESATTATAGTITVPAAGAKVIHVTAPAASHGTAAATVGQSEAVTLSVTAELTNAAGETLAYAWSKGDDAISGATAASYTIPAADLAAAGALTYTCVVSVDGDNTIDPVTVTFDVTVRNPALTGITVTGEGYTDGQTLAMVGPTPVVLDVAKDPANADGEILLADNGSAGVVTGALANGKLTITPYAVTTQAVDIVLSCGDVTKTIQVTVAKAAAPDPDVTADLLSATAPTAAGGLGSFTVDASKFSADTNFMYKKSDATTWTQMATNTVNVEPGEYLVRVKVANPTLQNTSEGAAITVPDYSAPVTVTSVTITGGSSVRVEGTLQLTAQVTMSDSTVSDTETVEWTSGDPAKATVSATGLVTGVAEGTVTITATSTTDSTKKAEKTITVNPKSTTPTVNKAALNAAVTAAETALEAAVESVDGTDVPTTGTWITTADKATLTAAIADAKTVAAKADATQAEVDAAKTAVENAAKAIKAGTKDEGGEQPADKAALNAAITAAETAQKAVKVSADGKDVATTAKWVDQEAMDAYTAAITAAKAVAEKTDATQEELTQAVADLAAATTAFEAAQAAGTKTSGGTTHRPSSSTTTVTTPVGTTTTTTTPDGTKVAVTAKDGVTTAVVTVPSGVDKTTVTIPVAEPDSGLVPVIVNADGTEEIVRMSVVTDEGVALTLDKSATVKLVNNAKEFVDVPGHWAEKSVDFTTARELFNGTDATHFAPNGAMTRGMMATVLFRLDGENKGETAPDFTDVADTWYTDAVAWAAQQGVVNGYGNGTFLPEKSINREELAVMVYRYAKALGLGYAAGEEIDDLTYADADQVSEWAYEAISWLTAKGVLNGKPGNVIDASGLATRAEVSTVLERFVKVAR